jgi:hypothetical protein
LFAGNAAGGILCEDSSPTILNCTFDSNYIYPSINCLLPGATPLIEGCTFTGNLSVPVSTVSDAHPTIVNCLFHNNLNGGLLLQTGATVANCTIVDNTAYSGGGIKCAADQSPSITNCIVRGNEPGEISGGTPVVTYCNVKGGYAGEGNIDADPLFVDPDHFDYCIGPGSPCIDAGDNAAVPAGIVVDLVGEPRFVDDPFTDDSGWGDAPLVDIGAYEYQPMDDCPADVNGDETVDVNDLFANINTWGDCVGCPEDITGDGLVNIEDLFEVINNWGPCA